MTPRVRAAVLSMLLASCGGAAEAKDLHVDNGSPRASDENAGTRRDRPLRTISAALAKAFPGDTVWIAAGTYRELLGFVRGGDGPDRRLRVAAVDGAKVTIKGSDVVTGWSPAGRGIWRRTGWTVNSQQVFVDGAPLRQIGMTSPFNVQRWGSEPILPATGSGVADMVPGSFFFDSAAATLHVRLPGDADPNGHLVEASVRDVVINSGPISHVELRGLAFAHSNTSALPSMRGIVNIEGNHWVVTGCTFTQGDFAGLSISGVGHRVRDSVASHNGDVGITINGSDEAHGWGPYGGRPRQDIVLEGNETSANNTRGFLSVYSAGGVKAANACNGVRISRHVARDNAGTGIWFDLGCHDVTIERARLDGNTRGIEYETSDAAVISGNVVTRSAQHGIYVNASSDVAVVDNTLDGNAWGIVVHGEPRAEHPRLERNEVRGNVISRSGKADLVQFVGAEANGNTSDFNDFYRPEGGVRISWTSTESYDVTHRDLGAFAASTGQDRHSSLGDPRLRSSVRSTRARAGVERP